MSGSKLTDEFKRDCKILFVAKVQPAGAVCQNISIHAGRRVQSRAHPLADRFIPVTFGGDIGFFPQVQLHLMNAAIVAAADEIGVALRDFVKGFDR